MGATRKQDTNKTRNRLASQWDPANLLLELVELMGIEPMTS
jgi:hypothetical protein